MLVRRYPPAKGYNLRLFSRSYGKGAHLFSRSYGKGAQLFSRSYGKGAPTPDFIINYYWQEDLISSLKDPILSNICGSHLINFHTRSTLFNTSKLEDQLNKTPN